MLLVGLLCIRRNGLDNIQATSTAKQVEGAYHDDVFTNELPINHRSTRRHNTGKTTEGRTQTKTFPDDTIEVRQILKSLSICDFLWAVEMRIEFITQLLVYGAIAKEVEEEDSQRATGSIRSWL